MGAPSYNLLSDFGVAKADYLSVNAHWAIAVIRLGYPLSFDRSTMSANTSDLTQGALLRADKPLIITGDCTNINITGSKSSHTKSMNATLKQTETNYLVELMPGDWVMAWMTSNADDFETLLKKIERNNPDNPCNTWSDGFKFIGRIHNVRKNVTVNPGTGLKTATYSLQCTGFEELDTQFFYDAGLASKDTVEKDIGSWLARIGRDVSNLYASDARTGIQLNNVDVLIPTMIDIIVGKGVSTNTSPTIAAGANGQDTVTAAPTKDAPLAYIIPTMVGRLLGKTQEDASKKTVLAYCDILELLQGVQTYPGEDTFTPQLNKAKSTPQRRVTTTPMLGTFLPSPPEFTNRPLWGVLQQFLNPAINEMYTALRVNPEGRVVPTIVLRQIPFTTDAFDPDSQYVKDRVQQGTGTGKTSLPDGKLPFTRFLSLPRWQMPGVMVHSCDIGRSNATRINFVHVYGQALYSKANISIGAQIVNNPPIMDSLDIQRSGLHSYMTTINCAVQDEVDEVPGLWMSLVADWMIGSQYTLNGHIESVLIQSPIVEGDNLEWDGVVYHIESVSHTGNVDASGMKTARTSLTLTNGMRSDNGDDSTVIRNDDGEFPSYPGFKKTDNTATDPKTQGDGGRTTGDDSDFSKTSSAQTPPALNNKGED